MNDEAIQRLLDIEELKKLKYRYNRLMDTKAWDHFRDLFTEDLEGPARTLRKIGLPMEESIRESSLIENYHTVDVDS